MKPSSLVVLFTSLAMAATTHAATTQYVTYSSHTDSGCASVPKQVAYVPQGAGSNTCGSATCVADSSTGLYLATGCVSDPSARSTTLFGTKPWLQFEIHEPNTVCATLASVIAYLADGTCLIVDGASSSIRAYVFANKSAAVARYAGASCSGSPTKTNTIASTKLARASCIEGAMLASTGNATADSAVGTNHAPLTKTASPSAIATLLAVVTTIVAMW